MEGYLSEIQPQLYRAGYEKIADTTMESTIHIEEVEPYESTNYYCWAIKRTSTPSLWPDNPSLNNATLVDTTLKVGDFLQYDIYKEIVNITGVYGRKTYKPDVDDPIAKYKACLLKRAYTAYPRFLIVESEDDVVVDTITIGDGYNYYVRGPLWDHLNDAQYFSDLKTPNNGGAKIFHQVLSTSKKDSYDFDVCFLIWKLNHSTDTSNMNETKAASLVSSRYIDAISFIGTIHIDQSLYDNLDIEGVLNAIKNTPLQLKLNLTTLTASAPHGREYPIIGISKDWNSPTYITELNVQTDDWQWSPTIAKTMDDYNKVKQNIHYMPVQDIQIVKTYSIYKLPNRIA